MADRQPLAVGGEDDLARDDETREPERMHLRAGDVRAPRLGMPLDVCDLDEALRAANLTEPLRELTRCSARRACSLECS